MDRFVLTPDQYDLLVQGTWITIRILVFAFILGVVLSLVFGIARLSEREWIRGVALAYVEFARGISSIILLFILAIAIPILLQIDAASRVILAAIALGLNMGGYGAEIVRGSIQAIPKGQTEASIALNLSATQRLRHIVLPQSMRLILPPMGNLTIEILKGTALVSLVGVTDIMQTVNNLRQQQLFAGSTAGIAVLFINALVIYFVIAQLLNGVFRYFEWRLNRRYEARNTPLPSQTNAGAGAGG